MLLPDMLLPSRRFFFFFNDPATPEIYTLSLHDALPISIGATFAPLLRGLWPSIVGIPSRSAPWTSPSPAASNTSRPTRRSEEHTSELQSQSNLVCRLLLEKKKKFIRKL